MTLASEYNTKYTQASIQPFFIVRPNRLSSTIGGNREKLGNIVKFKLCSWIAAHSPPRAKNKFHGRRR